MAEYMQHHQEWLKVMGKYPLLKRLHEARVFSVGVADAEGNTFNLVEECDVFFGETLTKDEMKTLASEILSYIENPFSDAISE